MPPRNGDPAVADFTQAFADLAVSVRVLLGTQASFMRSAASADPCIGASVSTPLLHSEALDAQTIDNTVDDSHRNGLPATLRDHRPLIPADLVTDPGDKDYDATDHRLSVEYGRGGHDDATSDRADQLSSWHRTRGRNIRSLDRLLPADGYMNTFSSPVDQ